jgi:hypothetical protein
LLFKEVVSTTKINSQSLAPILSEKISYYNIQTKSDDIFSIALANDDMIQIYWPYSARWDGKTLPTITYQPEYKEQDWNWGYQLTESENGVIVKKRVFVDDDYAYDNPVWIINSSSLSYETILSIREQSLSYSNILTKSGDAHPWILDQIRLTKQYDNLFQGANNIKMTVSIPPLTGYAVGQNLILFVISREDARKGNWVTLNRVLNDDWREEQITNHMFMVETD